MYILVYKYPEIRHIHIQDSPIKRHLSLISLYYWCIYTSGKDGGLAGGRIICIY